jgi:glucosamine 6-phosphate synthetase-like amidotransferase/phosphosugar isomerase protein
VALIHSEGILAGEMKHGPLALVDEHLPIVVVAMRDSMYSKMNSVIQQLLARNARLMMVCTERDENMKQYVKEHDCQLIEVRVGENSCWLVRAPNGGRAVERQLWWCSHSSSGFTLPRISCVGCAADYHVC